MINFRTLSCFRVFSVWFSTVFENGVDNYHIIIVRLYGSVVFVCLIGFLLILFYLLVENIIGELNHNMPNDMEGFIEVNEISDFVAYLRSIEWQDPWLMGLISFHIIITFTCFSTRNYGNFQVMLFITLLLLVYFSESINEVAARHWTLFSRQQYFDSKGLFISVVFSIPILLNCMIMVGSWLYQSTQVMAKLKTAQLKQRLKELRLKEQQHLKSE